MPHGQGKRGTKILSLQEATKLKNTQEMSEKMIKYRTRISNKNIVQEYRIRISYIRVSK